MDNPSASTTSKGKKTPSGSSNAKPAYGKDKLANLRIFLTTTGKHYVNEHPRTVSHVPSEHLINSLSVLCARLAKKPPGGDYNAGSDDMSPEQGEHLHGISVTVYALAALIWDNLEELGPGLADTGFFGLFLPILIESQRCNVEQGRQLQAAVERLKGKKKK